MWPFKSKPKLRKGHRTFTIEGGMWGRNIDWMTCDGENSIFKVSGHWTPKPVKGDKLTGKFESGVTREFVFIKMRHCGDPPDMFFADLAYIGVVGKENKQ